MKFNPIFAILGLIFGFLGAFGAYGLSGFDAQLVTNGSITLISSILGLLGIYLFNKNYKIAIVQYIICGLGVLIGTSLFGVLGFIFYLIAGVVSYVERIPVNSTQANPNTTHTFGNNTPVNNLSPVTSNNKTLWIIPVVSIIILLFVGIFGGLSYDNDMNSKSQSIEITNITSDLKVSYGYYTGGVQGDLKAQRDLGNVQVKARWYSDSGAQLDETYDSNVISDIKANQTYKLNFPYFKSSDNKPSKAEIIVYQSSDKILYSHNVTFNEG